MPPTKSNAEIVTALETLSGDVKATTEALKAEVRENTLAQRKLEKRVAVALAGDIEDPESKPGILGRVKTLEDGADTCSTDRRKIWAGIKTLCGLIVTIVLAIVGWILAKI